MSQQTCCSNCGGDHNGFTTGMILGVLLGVAAGYALSTDKGKEKLDYLAENAKSIVKNVMGSETVQETIANVKESLQEFTAPLNTPPADDGDAPRPKFFFRSGSPLHS